MYPLNRLLNCNVNLCTVSTEKGPFYAKFTLLYFKNRKTSLDFKHIFFLMSQQPLTTSRIGLPFSEKKIIPQNTEQTKIRLFPSESHLFRGTENARNSFPNNSVEEKKSEFHSEPFSERKLLQFYSEPFMATEKSTEIRSEPFMKCQKQQGCQQHH